MRILSSVLLLLLTSCLASHLNSTEKGASFTPTDIKGVVHLTNGTSIDLKDLENSPLLLVFAQETCTVCRAETLGFKNEIEQLNSINLKVVTVLVGSVLEDAIDWKSADNWEDAVEVPWDVGFERKPELFSQLCPNSGTPCSLLQIPGRGVVLKHSGLLNPADVIEIIESEKK